MEYYNKIAKGYNELHQEEQEQKLAIIKQYLKPTKSDFLLDIGCGTGISTQFNCNCIGIDPSNELIKIAKKNYPITKFLLANAEELPFSNNIFDYVISVTAAQNFKDINKAIREINRVAKPNSKICITILKKSQKVNLLKSKLKGYKLIEQEKDYIFIK